MGMVLSNLLVLLGSATLILSYYYLGSWWRRYLSYIGEKADYSKGFMRDFYQMYHSLYSSGTIVFPFTGAIVSYLLICSGIVVTFNQIDSTTAAAIYSSLIAAAFMAFNVVCVMFEKKRATSKIGYFLRLISINIVIAICLLGNGLVETSAMGKILPSIAYFTAVTAAIVLPCYRFVWRSDD